MKMKMRIYKKVNLIKSRHFWYDLFFILILFILINISSFCNTVKAIFLNFFKPHGGNVGIGGIAGDCDVVDDDGDFNDDGDVNDDGDGNDDGDDDGCNVLLSIVSVSIDFVVEVKSVLLGIKLLLLFFFWFIFFNNIDALRWCFKNVEIFTPCNLCDVTCVIAGLPSLFG